MQIRYDIYRLCAIALTYSYYFLLPLFLSCILDVRCKRSSYWSGTEASSGARLKWWSAEQGRRDREDGRKDERAQREAGVEPYKPF